MSRIGILKNAWAPAGWQSCDWTNAMKSAIAELGYGYHLVDSSSHVEPDVMFYMTRLNHNIGYKNTPALSARLSKIATEFEEKGARLAPTSYAYRLYENKATILNLFEKCGVNKPKTWYVESEDQIAAIDTFPVVLKHAYSCASNYMDQARNKKEYEKKIRNFLIEHGSCIVQQKISFTKEARVTYVGDKAIHGYYRVKPDSDSLSASTKFGSIVDFDIDLEAMSGVVKEFRNKTNINIAAFDVVWDSDDESTEPYFFEVSPIFSMNVPGPVGKAYKSFKGTPEFKRLEKNIQQKYYKETIQFYIDKLKLPTIYCDIDYTINNHVPRVKKWTRDGQINPKYGHYDEIMLDPPNLQAREILNSIKNKYRIVFLTARGNFPQAYLSTRDWLINNNFHYDQIIVVNNFEDKLKTLLEDNKTHLFIDDLTRGHHTDKIEIVKENVRKLYYNNIPFIRYDNNWEKISALCQ